MGESDGGVLLDVKLNPEDPAKEFDRLSKKAVGLEDKLTQAKNALALATNEASMLGARLDEAKAAQARLEASGTATADQLKFQAETVDSLQARYDAADREAERLAGAVAKTNSSLEATKTRAAQVAQEMGKGSSALSKIGIYAEKVENRLKRLATRVLAFSVFTSMLRNLRSWFADVIKTDKDAVGAIAQLKGALLTLIQPLVGVVIPAFTAFVQVLAQVVGALATVTAAIFGTTLEESAEAAENLNAEKKALDGLGASAKKAGKSMASFDEINKIGGDNAGSSASKSKEIAPDFSGLANENLGFIETIVSGALLGLGAVLTFSGANVPLGLGLMAIGAAGLATAISANWETISELMKGPLGTLTAVVSGATLALGAVLLFSGANIPLGFGLLVMGASGLATAIAANWNEMPEGVKMAIGLLTSVLSVALLGLGASLAFSGANVPLGLGLMAAGAVGLATAVSANWETITQFLEGPIGAITGILSAALLVIGGTLLFSGANIGLGLGLMVVGAVGLASSLAANWDTITELLNGPVGTITAILSTAFLVIGGILAFSGVNIPLGLGLMVAGAVGLAASLAANWDMVTQLLNGPVGAITALISGALLVLGAVLFFSGANMPLGLGLLIAGGVGLAATVGPNWNAILEALKDAWNNIKSWWSSNVSKFLTVDYWKELGSGIISGLLNGLTDAFEKVKSWANDAFGWLTSKFSGATKDTSQAFEKSHAAVSVQSAAAPFSARLASMPSINASDIPRLAKGAVIPANREFAAVLGDQTHGNNLEGPEALFRQIVREETGAAASGMNSAGIISILQQILAAIKEGKVMVMDQTVFAQIVSSSMDSEDFRRGSPMVTLR